MAISMEDLQTQLFAQRLVLQCLVRALDHSNPDATKALIASLDIIAKAPSHAGEDPAAHAAFVKAIEAARHMVSLSVAE